MDGLKEVPIQPSCTSMPQSWDKPRGTKIAPEPVCTMVISKPGNTNRKKRPLVADFHDNRYSTVVVIKGIFKAVQYIL